MVEVGANTDMVNTYAFYNVVNMFTTPMCINTINKTLSLEVHSGTFLFGNLFETFVVNEIIHYRDYLRKDFIRLFFYLRRRYSFRPWT